AATGRRTTPRDHVLTQSCLRPRRSGAKVDSRGFAMATLALNDVSKVHPEGTKAVAGIDLAIEDGEFFVLVGPSGCGKTSVLRVGAGLAPINRGGAVVD